MCKNDLGKKIDVVKVGKESLKIAVFLGTFALISGVISYVDANRINLATAETLEETEAEEQTEDKSIDAVDNSINKKYKNELETIYAFKDKWEVVDSEVEDSYGETIKLDDYAYTISDLDNDDNLEIIVSGWAGSGHFSFNRIFEYKNDDKIEEMNLEEFCNDDSEPDLLLQNEINNDYESANGKIIGYIDAEGNSNYVLTNKEFWGSEGGKIRYLILNIKDNNYSCNLIAYKQESKDTIKYYDSDGHVLSKDDFDKKIESYIGSNEKKNVELNWFTEVNLDNMLESSKVIKSSITKNNNEEITLEFRKFI